MADDPGSVLLEHYRDQLAEERSTKLAIERRGQAVVATNGAIATLLFAFGDITVDLTTGAGQAVVVLLICAMLFLAISAGFGLLANRAEPYGVTNVDKLVDLAANDAVRTAADRAAAQQNVALDIAQIIWIAEKANDGKGKRLRRAVNWQVAGLAVLAVTLLVNVLSATP